MSSFTPYYNDYTNNPSPSAGERLQQEPPLQPGKTFVIPSISKTSKWTKYLWIAFVIFACICLLVATIVPIVVVILSTSQIQTTG